ncbi:MAG: hypothetical protein ACKO45_11780 [Cyanobium sp.]
MLPLDQTNWALLKADEKPQTCSRNIIYIMKPESNHTRQAGLFAPNLSWCIQSYYLAIAQRVKLYKRDAMWRIMRPKIEFRIISWYGRTGNNIQQLIVALAHSIHYKGSLTVTSSQLSNSPLDGIIQPFGEDFSSGPTRKATQIFASNLFHYTEFSFLRIDTKRSFFKRGYWPRRETTLGRMHIESHAHQIAHEVLSAHLVPSTINPTYQEWLAQNSLVIHMRAGDIADLQNDLYMTNPLSYYRRLAQNFDRVLIVTEPELNHPLIAKVAKLFSQSRISSGSVSEDFDLLRNAVNLASSGPGTFVVAAALLSRRLRRFYCTDLFLDEHLNPRMIRKPGISVNIYSLKGFAKAWMSKSDRLGILEDY